MESTEHYITKGLGNFVVLGKHHVNVAEYFHCMQVWQVLETLLRQGTLQNHSRNLLKTGYLTESFQEFTKE